MMGSPDSEKGRFEDEGPQHEVRISQGIGCLRHPYSAYGQLLWEKIPVDLMKTLIILLKMSVGMTVRNSLRKFCKSSELNLTLPTEAEWEWPAGQAVQRRTTVWRPA